MKKILFPLLLLISFINCYSQSSKDDNKYLAGAVPLVDGYVQFDTTYHVKGKNQAEIMQILQSYTQKQLVEGEEQLPQARITEVSPETGTIAASIEEYMYFKRTNWQIHRVRFYYQIIFHVSDEQYTVTIRRLHYRYDPEVTAGDFDDDRRAEQWITDDNALTKNKTKLARVSGKFRRFTIDRVNEIFHETAKATGAIVKTIKWIEVEE